MAQAPESARAQALAAAAAAQEPAAATPQ